MVTINNTIEEQFMLTTVDNPFNPFIHYDKWLEYDREKGYDTPGLLARIAFVSPDLSEEQERIAINKAIDEIIKENVYGIHKRISNLE